MRRCRVNVHSTQLIAAFRTEGSHYFQELVSYAISKLQQQNVWLYLDAGNSGWLGWPTNLSPAAQLFGKVLSGAGNNATVRGLATDVSSYNLLRGVEDKAAAPNPNYNEELYINALAPFLTQNNFPAHFIVDRKDLIASCPTVFNAIYREPLWCFGY
jgi:cellulose 1,4-beta-cellobiosidase